jgi:hypothetical protein
MSITTRHRSAALWRIGMKPKGCVWAARGALRRLYEQYNIRLTIAAVDAAYTLVNPTGIILNCSPWNSATHARLSFSVRAQRT